MSEDGWKLACNIDDIDIEDVALAVIDGRSIAVYRTASDKFFASDAYCTHERQLLTDGLLQGNIIECPKHNGRFDVRTGEAKSAPVCINLTMYEARRDGDDILVLVPAGK